VHENHINWGENFPSQNILHATMMVRIDRSNLPLT
jgi:hypothetical protein